MGDVAIVYKKECHYGDVLKIEVTAAEFGSRSFDLFYRFIKTKTNEIACEAKTGIICYDYKEKKTVNVPDEFRNRFG
jgi:acyl-CoA thioesterase FadM